VLASVPNTLLIANDLAGTAHRVASSVGIFRASFAAYLIEATCDITLDGAILLPDGDHAKVAFSATRPAALAVSPIRCHSSPNHRNRVKHRDCPAKRHDP
jgi:hypothetical protein